jgi:hypothetical protein
MRNIARAPAGAIQIAFTRVSELVDRTREWFDLARVLAT